MKDSELIERITRIAAEVALGHLEKQQKQQSKTKHDRRLRNTKLLLRHYRSLSEHCAELRVDALMRDVDASEELDDEALTIKAIKVSKERTLKMVRFVERMLESYRVHCERKDDLRQYQTLELLYMDPRELTVEQVAELQNIEPRTVYRDVNSACETLSVLIFGIDGIRFVE